MKIKVTLIDGTVIEIDCVRDVVFNTWDAPTIQARDSYEIRVASPC